LPRFFNYSSYSTDLALGTSHMIDYSPALPAVSILRESKSCHKKLMGILLSK
jgi:hypothetical protein